mgnify:CR=1 FL=1
MLISLHNLNYYYKLMEGLRKSIKEGFASKAVASTKPKKAIISEGADMASRFKKLAGLTK